MFECPRSAFMPPPAMPILPSSNCTMAPVRMICDPMECCVQPRAYRTVAARLVVAVDASISHTFRNLSLGVPQTRSTMSSV
ncbi:hypothetical protein D3C85_577500 [compost metagenome]